jgi:glucose-6-phosphate isomerase
MITLDISHLLFSKSFLEIKYRFQSEKVMESIRNKYEKWYLSFLDVSRDMNIKKIQDYVKEKKADFESVVVLWIWWSALGIKAIFQAIKWKYYNEQSKEKRWWYPKLYVIDNVDPMEISNIIDILDIKKTLFIVISKSWTTLETISQYKFFRTYVDEQWLDYKKHFVVITWKNSVLSENAIKDWLQTFDIPENIWGRFSAFTNVWLLPLAFVWICIEDLLWWVENMKKELLWSDFFENKALLTSIIQYHSYIELWKNVTVFFPYIWNLTLLWEWYRQMIGESLWKKWIWVTLTNAVGVTDQHSQLQLYYDWPNDKLIIFLELEEFWKNYHIVRDSNLTFSSLMKAEKFWTEESISNSNKINYTIRINKVDEKTLGELVVFFEMQAVILWELYWFDPFDQPWVEMWKKIAKQKIRENVGMIEIMENISF